MQIANQSDLQEAGKRGTAALYPQKTKITVGSATCGVASGADEVFQTLTEEIEKRSLDYIIERTGCVGFCEQEPLVDVLEPNKPKLTYGKMTADKARKLIAGLAEGDGFFKEWAIYRIEEEENIVTDSKIPLPVSGSSEGIKEVPLFQEHPFFCKQKRIILRNCGLINPDDIEEYIARGGYLALHKALTEMTPEKIIQEVLASGIRGRGGAGFPTGKKWEICRNMPGDTKYIICNADEGDPGAYMDRSVLEGDPHSVLEGLAIGAFAIGAQEAYIYVRAEYPLAIKRLHKAIAQAEEAGLLGEKIFGTNFGIKIKIVEGAGAFVCGEETGLLASIEGRVGDPHQRPPYPAEKGLWGKPTNINNVKTWASISPIISRGGSWYASIGKKGDGGTTVFSLVGKIKNNGLAEVPLGINLKEMVFEIGGGPPEGKKFKAVQTGGPSGGCIPEKLIDIPVDYEQLSKAGSMMGSGGMIVMDDHTCMVDVARYFLEFTTVESCGKCTPCREGTQVMLKILTRIVEGRGQPGDIERLERLGAAVKDASLCGLGGTAPNPVLTTIRYFRDEYEAHIKEHKCPGHVCPALITYSIEPEACNGCGACARQCPSVAIEGEKDKIHWIIADKCIKCGACLEVCPSDAVKVE